MREIRMLRAMWRVLETGLRQLLNGHEDGNVGYSQGVSYGLPRQRPTLPAMALSRRRNEIEKRLGQSFSLDIGIRLLRRISSLWRCGLVRD